MRDHGERRASAAQGERRSAEDSARETARPLLSVNAGARACEGANGGSVALAPPPRTAGAPAWWWVATLALVVTVVADGRLGTSTRRGAPGPAPPASRSIAGDSPKSSLAADGAVDWSRAGPRELRTLPGIGAVRALALAQARWRDGAQVLFERLEEQPGIGPLTAERVRLQIGRSAGPLARDTTHVRADVPDHVPDHLPDDLPDDVPVDGAQPARSTPFAAQAYAHPEDPPAQDGGEP